MATGRAQKSKNTDAELRVQQALIDVGLSDFVTHKTIPLPAWAGKNQRTTPDMLFRDEMLAVFVDGCFWHMCLQCYRDTKSDTAAWRGKGARQRARDQRHSRCLETLGYRVLRVWEHEDPAAAAKAALAILETNQDPGTFGLS